MALLPDVQTEELEFSEESSNTFIALNGQIAGMDDGFEAVKQTIHVILTTERYRYQIYSGNFGAELESLIGKDREYIKVSLPAIVRDALSVDNRIIDAVNFNYEFMDNNVHVTFDVNTVYGVVNAEVQI